MLNGQIKLDYNYMLSDYIGEENGLEANPLESLKDDFQRVHTEITSRQGAGADFLGFLDLPYQDHTLLEAVQAEADAIAEKSDMHIALGIGGSYLGAKALMMALCHPYHNSLDRAGRKGRPRFFFEGNNIDTDALQALVDLLPQTPPQTLAQKWSINVISKSGGTIETAVAFRYLRHLAEQHYGDEASNYITATTDGSKGKLHALAKSAGYPMFTIPDNVGGRYSIFTPVGLLPAAVLGIDIKALIQGAKDMAELCKNPDPYQNPAYLYAGLQYRSYQAGRGISVMNIWDKALEYVGFWYDQLCAESLGKDEQGRIPLTGVCTRDLHARGQQLQQGPRNTVITNLYISKSNHSLSLESDEHNFDALNYLGDMPLDHMLEKAYKGTNFAYAQDGRPTLSIELAERSPYCLGALFYMLEVATLAEGYLMQINPLDQPGVEDYKNFMFGLLGREDRAEYKASFEERRPESKENSL